MPKLEVRALHWCCLWLVTCFNKPVTGPSWAEAAEVSANLQQQSADESTTRDTRNAAWLGLLAPEV